MSFIEGSKYQERIEDAAKPTFNPSHGIKPGMTGSVDLSDLPNYPRPNPNPQNPPDRRAMEQRRSEVDRRLANHSARVDAIKQRVKDGIIENGWKGDRGLGDLVALGYQLALDDEYSAAKEHRGTA